ncbi:hypothetical protein [Qipengyuania soli]|uniref:Uncharacterized protein n=1 Tax=Qipengyuania soli TaxID=2782568 RepID=A0A7S8IVA1_9SPHN|nr:hypothetical protein [Qipengyuania soli]QPC98581.1 hypothetical protein IRL76_12125 [Qipengyuania soli]
MTPKTFLVLGVFLAGLLLTYLVGRGMLDMDIDEANGGFFLLGAIVLAGFPALLAALSPRVAIATLAVIAALLGLWGASVLSIPGDGAIGGFLLLVVDFAFVLYGLAIIGLRKLIIKKPVTQDDL